MDDKKFFMIAGLAIATIFAVFMGIAYMIFLYDPVVNAKEGEIITCSDCGKTIKNTVHTVETKKSELQSHKINKRKQLCDNCKKVDVITGSKVVCSNCGTTIVDRTYNLQVKNSELDNYKIQELSGLCDDCKYGDPDLVATSFAKAIMNREIDTATQYCESTVIDDLGMFGLWGIAYDSRYVCSTIAAKIDDNWIYTKRAETDKDNANERYFVFANPNCSYKRQINGNTVKADGGFALGMHQAGGKWRIHKIKTGSWCIY